MTPRSPLRVCELVCGQNTKAQLGLAATRCKVWHYLCGDKLFMLGCAVT